uniref:Uncharacterized protein n=1 Tax=Brassica campestris TaxID=3711 RepID=M4DM25_BRACM
MTPTAGIDFAQNDGLHIKQEWTAAIEDETRRLKETVDDHESMIRSLGRVEYRIDRIDQDAQKTTVGLHTFVIRSTRWRKS